MNAIDALIIVVALLAVIRGLEIGLARQALSLVGFFGGLFLGSWLAPMVVVPGQTQATRSLLTLAITLGAGIVLSTAGDYIGLRIQGFAHRHGLGPVDVALGSVMEVVSVLVAAWLIGSVLAQSQLPGLRREAQQSLILQTLHRDLPPAPGVISRLARLIDPNGFPNVFIGLEPTPPPAQLPSDSTIRAAAIKDEPSVVKIEGRGCGGIIEGSGFVAGNGFVATNAHVIAGIEHPVVIDGSGQHSAVPVFFDPNMDFAVLRVNGLAGAPLAMETALEPAGTASAVLGYPGGGGYTAGPAAVSDSVDAVGQNIYDQGQVTREIYELSANVQPGNSGGPLVLPDGTVAGLVFARSVDQSNVGYALTMRQIMPDLRQAESSPYPTGTGACAAP